MVFDNTRCPVHEEVDNKLQGETSPKLFDDDNFCVANNVQQIPSLDLAAR